MSAVFDDYKAFLTRFLAQDYAFMTFRDALTASDLPQARVLLRHDIDCDCACAFEIAKQEHELGITSTYFFMLSSDFYNALSSENVDYIKQIQALGHEVSLHYDPTIYDDVEAGLVIERELFRSRFSADVDVVSIHKPSDVFLNSTGKVAGIEHTYMPKYFREMEYVSDSTGEFRYGLPFDRAAFSDRQPIHLLLHPVWWVVKGESNRDKVSQLLAVKHQEMKVAASRVLFNDDVNAVVREWVINE